MPKTTLCSKYERIIFIGLPGSGKSTLAQKLAQNLDWLFIDTDSILEAWYGTPLEDLKNYLGNTDFLKAESETILSLNVNRGTIGTGGSIVYSPKAMNYLKEIGIIIYLQIEYKTLVNRINLYPHRGLIIQPNQKLIDIYKERTPLYESYADFTVQTDHYDIFQSVKIIQDWYYACVKKHQEKKSDL